MNNIYCDMDGVLADFLSGAVIRLNEILENPPPEFEEQAAAVASVLGRCYVVKEDLEKLNQIDQYAIKVIDLEKDPKTKEYKPKD